MDMHPLEQSLCTCSVASLHMRSINLLLDIPRIYGNMGMSADRIFISPALALIKIRLCVLGMQFSRCDIKPLDGGHARSKLACICAWTSDRLIDMSVKHDSAIMRMPM